MSLFYIHQFTYASALLWILNVLSTVDLYYYPGFKVTVLCDDLRANLHYLEKNPNVSVRSRICCIFSECIVSLKELFYLPFGLGSSFVQFLNHVCQTGIAARSFTSCSHFSSSYCHTVTLQIWLSQKTTNWKIMTRHMKYHWFIQSFGNFFWGHKVNRSEPSTA